MLMGQIEFALVVSVLSAYLIFTPERLVLLRNLLLWAIMTWTAWHGYDSWQRSPWTRKVITAFVMGRGLPDIAGLVWDKAFGACVDWGTKRATAIRRECTRISAGAYNWLRDLLGWPQGDATASGPSPLISALCRDDLF
jgi:hypothetical protein